VERADGDDEFVSTPDEVEVVPYRTGERDVPDDHTVGGELVGHRPLDRARGLTRTRHGQRGEVVGAARIAAEVWHLTHLVRAPPLVQRLALLGGEARQPGVGGRVGQDAVRDQGVGAQSAQGEAGGGGA
jgi:hypothetical protein